MPPVAPPSSDSCALARIARGLGNPGSPPRSAGAPCEQTAGATPIAATRTARAIGCNIAGVMQGVRTAATPISVVQPRPTLCASPTFGREDAQKPAKSRLVVLGGTSNKRNKHHITTSSSRRDAPWNGAPLLGMANTDSVQNQERERLRASITTTAALHKCIGIYVCFGIYIYCCNSFGV